MPIANRTPPQASAASPGDSQADWEDRREGLTLVRTRLYFKHAKIKMGLALARGKQAHDKRETIKRREVDRKTRAAVKERQR
jgi:tmRNA-binding protein